MKRNIGACWQLFLTTQKVRYKNTKLAFVWFLFQGLFLSFILLKAQAQPISFLSVAKMIGFVNAWLFFFNSVVLSIDCLIVKHNILLNCKISNAFIPLAYTACYFTDYILLSFVYVILLFMANSLNLIFMFSFLLFSAGLFLFVFSCSLLGSILYVFFKDIKYLVFFAMQALFFLMPFLSNQNFESSNKIITAFPIYNLGFILQEIVLNKQYLFKNIVIYFGVIIIFSILIYFFYNKVKQYIAEFL